MTGGKRDVLDLTNWRFVFNSARPVGATASAVNLVTPVALLLHLADDYGLRTAMQHQIRERLSVDPIAQRWHRKRTRLRALPHFRRYRMNKYYDQYHQAARAVSSGISSKIQQDMTKGLAQEIATSKVIVPAGQVLFHGRGDCELHESATYPSFISTSLDPTVCTGHAIKRQHRGARGRATVYVLTLRDPLPVIWGNGGQIVEWELLLQPRLSCLIVNKYPAREFDVVEASIGLPGTK